MPQQHKGKLARIKFPGSHADIGGGYDPLEDEYLFLSRPAIETVLGNVPVEATSAYQKAAQQAELLWRHSTLAPILPSGVLKIESNIDEIASPDHLGNVRKRVAAAVTFRRTITNDWSKIALRVMYEVAKEAGVVFDAISVADKELKVPSHLKVICEKQFLRVKPFSCVQRRCLFLMMSLKPLGNIYTALPTGIPSIID